MKYTACETALKMKICEEYATGHISYRQLAKKYNVNSSSLASWIQKYKAMNSIVPLSKNSGFYKITPRELSQELEAGDESQSIPFSIKQGG